MRGDPMMHVEMRCVEEPTTEALKMREFWLSEKVKDL